MASSGSEAVELASVGAKHGKTTKNFWGRLDEEDGAAVCVVSVRCEVGLWRRAVRDVPGAACALDLFVTSVPVVR